MASIEKISKAYRGKLAANYDAVRDRQQRWHLENEIVARMLPSETRSVLDCPIGTGRFIALYRKRGVDLVIGIDSSAEMIALAKKKLRRGDKIQLLVGDATDLTHGSGQDNDSYDVDTAVCVRFLNLVEEEALALVMRELARVARHTIILTIRLGPKYHSRSSMATHDERKFKRLIGRLNWRVAEQELIFTKGWYVMRLERK